VKNRPCAESGLSRIAGQEARHEGGDMTQPNAAATIALAGALALMVAGTGPGWAQGDTAVNPAANPAVNGPDSLREGFRDWAVNCATRPVAADGTGGGRVCELIQQIDHQDSGQRVLTFSLRINDAGQPVAVLIAPFGLRLAEGLRVQVGEEIIARLPFETCLPEGCVVIAPMEPAAISAMQNGVEGGVIMVSRQGEPVGVPISLMGFTAGLERLRVLSTP